MTSSPAKSCPRHRRCAREGRGLARGAFGATPKNSSPKEFADLIATDIKKWSEVVEKGGIERI
jgi:hypothetical protein